MSTAIELFLLNVRDDTKLSDNYNELIQKLPEIQRAAVKEKKVFEDGVEALGSKLLQYYAVSQLTNAAFHEIEITLDDNKKPVNKFSLFNTSHEHGQVVVLASLSNNVGIDVTHSEVDDSDTDYLAMILTAKELEQVARARPKRLFSVYWAVKEAFLKYLGTGLLSIEPTDVEVELPPLQGQSHQAASTIVWEKGVATVYLKNARQSAYVRIFYIGSLVGAVVAERDVDSVHVWQVPQTLLLAWANQG